MADAPNEYINTRVLNVYFEVYAHLKNVAVNLALSFYVIIRQTMLLQPHVLFQLPVERDGQQPLKHGFHAELEVTFVCEEQIRVRLASSDHCVTFCDKICVSVFPVHALKKCKSKFKPCSRL